MALDRKRNLEADGNVQDRTKKAQATLEAAHGILDIDICPTGCSILLSNLGVLFRMLKITFSPYRICGNLAHFSINHLEPNIHPSVRVLSFSKPC